MSFNRSVISELICWIADGLFCLSSVFSLGKYYPGDANDIVMMMILILLRVSANKLFTV